MSTTLRWISEQLDEMCARVTAEAASKADRIITEMDTFTPFTWSTRLGAFRLTGEWGPEVSAYSDWERRRIIGPRIYAELMADLEALDAVEERPE